MTDNYSGENYFYSGSTTVTGSRGVEAHFRVAAGRSLLGGTGSGRLSAMSLSAESRLFRAGFLI
jgi:hypothetical protein